MSIEQKRFYERLTEEIETISSFENNDGRPSGELKLLDAGALQQLESGLSVEDQ